MAEAPGPLIGAGRASRVFDLGDGRVLRRFIGSGDAAYEARVMAHAHTHDYPCPVVHEIRDDGLVLDRVHGPTMAEALFADPGRTVELARILAGLHHRLHEIPAPRDLRDEGGTALVHLDLHPNNVLLSERDPIVIDWTNAARGPAALDPALLWTILAPLDVARPFLDAFLAEFDLEQVRAALPQAVAKRLADPSVTGDERFAVRSLLG